MNRWSVVVATPVPFDVNWLAFSEPAARPPQNSEADISI